MKTRISYLLMLILACCLASAAALANELTGKVEPWCTDSSTEASGILATPVVFKGTKQGGDDPGVTEQATCSADCEDGSKVFCSGTSCSAYDNTCSSTSSFAGYCYGTTTGYKYCPSCCTKRVTAICPGQNQTCIGTCAGSFAVDGCWAYCDGTLYWCDPTGEELCLSPGP